jgi:Kef-type K+ transport system membrane component KefB
MVVELPVLVKERRFGMAAASIMTYGGVLAVVLALTISSISVPIAINQDYQVLAFAMAVVYLIALVLLYGSYKASFDISADHLDQWAKSAQQSFSAQFKTRHGYGELS